MSQKTEFPTYPPLFFVRITENLRNFFLRMNRRFTHPNVVLWEMTHGLWLAAGIRVAAALGLADLLKEKSLTTDELAELTGMHEESLYRIMRMLASQGIFREQRGKKFSSTPLAKPLQEDQIRYLILTHVNPRHFQMFSEIMTSVKTGKAVSGETSGTALFERIGNDEKKNARFNKAMTNASRMQASTILSAYTFNRYRNIIDVGGGQGLFLAAILDHSKECKGIVFDLPGALLQSGEVIANYSLEDRMKAEGGDFFEKVPEGGDLYMMKSVLHDWHDDDSIKILRNVHNAMDPGSRLLIIESVIETGNKPSFGKMTDMLMMVAAGGKERTRTEYEALLEQTGFRIRKIHPTISPHSLIEAEKVVR